MDSALAIAWQERCRAGLLLVRPNGRLEFDWDRGRPSTQVRSGHVAATVAAAVTEEWIRTVVATSIGLRPFAARKRDEPRFAPPREVQHLQFEFQRWDGPSGPWHEHFGKGRGQVISLDGTEPLRSCNEIEVAKRLRMVRDHAFWFSGFDTTHIPEIWRPWLRECSQSAMPDWLASLDETIRAKIASKAGGMPDVVAWNDRQSLRSALFVECKGTQESFTESQEDWVWAALDSGVRLSQLAVSLRPF